jgi:hypothetical protein
MAGELWREVVQYGKETTAGTAVAATRKAYLQGVSFTKQRDARYHKFATGSRDNTRAFTSGAVQAGGSVKVPVSADELIEWLAVTLQGGVTPTTPSGATNARLWTYTPGTSLDSMTIERNDGANLQRLVGVRGNQLTIAGSVGGDNAATIDLFAQDREDAWAGPLTAALTDRTPNFLEGWQTYLWIDSFGGTPGSTMIPYGLINWNLVIGNNLGRKYTARNTKAASAITFGELDVTATLVLEASAAQAVSELANWNADTKRLVRLEFVGPANEVEVGANEAQTVTITGTPTGGTFTLTAFGATTSAIAYNAASAAVQAALEALTTIGVGNVAVTGGPGPGTPYVATFQGDLAARDLPQMTATGSFTGGATPAVAVTTTTPGRWGGRYFSIDLPGAWNSPDTNQEDAGTRGYSFPLSYVYDTTNAFGIRVRCHNGRTTAFA